MTTHFYVPPERVHGDRLVLPDDEARHATRVLRLSVGDEIIAVDGAGGWYRVTLDRVGRTEAAGRIIERRTEIGEPSYRLTLAAGIIKNRGRFETLLEKAVELGAAEIVPLITDRTEKEHLRQHRAENILIAAMKQCGRSRLPLLRDPAPFADVLARDTEMGLCCHEASGPAASLLGRLEDGPKPSEVTVLIGPEGGFTDEEVDLARAAGYAVVSLGRRRLRAETAAIAAASIIALVCDA